MSQFTPDRGGRAVSRPLIPSPDCPTVDIRSGARYFVAGMDTFRQQRQGIIAVGRKMAGRNMVAGSDGNVSVRLGREKILITPSGRPVGSLKPDDLVIISSSGDVGDNQLVPSSESPMHLFLYHARPEIGAIVHSHSPYTTAFATAGVKLQWRAVPELIVSVGPVPLTAYATPGTDEVPEALKPVVADHHAFLLKNHGLLTLGSTLEEAFHRHEIVEHAAQILCHSGQLGGAVELGASEVAKLNNPGREL